MRKQTINGTDVAKKGWALAGFTRFSSGLHLVYRHSIALIKMWLTNQVSAYDKMLVSLTTTFGVNINLKSSQAVYIYVERT